MIFMRKFLNRRFFIIPIILWTVGITVARGFRFPNNYSQSHWLLDYRFGFMKRGFVGSICSFFTSILGVKMTSGAITVLSSIVYAAFIVSFLILAFMLLKKYDYSRNISAIILIFVSSPFFVMSGHLFGYFDALLFVVVISSLFLIEKEHFLPAALISSMAILVHESYLLIGLPVVYLSIYLKYFSKKSRNPEKVNIAIILLPVFTFVFMTIYGMFFIDNKFLFDQLIKYLNSFDFIYAGKKGVPHWQTIGFLELLETQRNTAPERIFQLRNITAYYPSLLAIMFFIHLSFRIKVFYKDSLLVLISVLTPFFMYFVAFDVVRISLNTLGLGFIALWVMKMNRKSFNSGDSFMLIGMSVFFLNVFARVTLMGKHVDKFTDFERTIFYLPAFIYMIFLIYSKNTEQKATFSGDVENVL